MSAFERTLRAYARPQSGRESSDTPPPIDARAEIGAIARSGHDIAGLVADLSAQAEAHFASRQPLGRGFALGECDSGNRRGRSEFEYAAEQVDGLCDAIALPSKIIHGKVSTRVFQSHLAATLADREGCTVGEWVRRAIRNGDRETLAGTLDRETVGQLSHVLVASLCEGATATLRAWLSVAVSDHLSPNRIAVLGRTVQLACVLLQRLCFVAATEVVREVFGLVRGFQCSDVSRCHHTPSSEVAALLRAVTRCLPLEELLRDLPALIDAAVPSEDGDDMGHQTYHDWFDPIGEFQSRRMNRRSFTAEESAAWSRLMPRIEQASGFARTRLIGRAAILLEEFETGSRATGDFREALYARVDEHGVPTDLSEWSGGTLDALLLRFPPVDGFDETAALFVKHTAGEKLPSWRQLGALATSRSDTARVLHFTPKQYETLTSQIPMWVEARVKALKQAKSNSSFSQMALHVGDAADTDGFALAVTNLFLLRKGCPSEQIDRVLEAVGKLRSHGERLPGTLVGELACGRRTADDAIGFLITLFSDAEERPKASWLVEWWSETAERGDAPAIPEFFADFLIGQIAGPASSTLPEVFRSAAALLRAKHRFGPACPRWPALRAALAQTTADQPPYDSDSASSPTQAERAEATLAGARLAEAVLAKHPNDEWAAKWLGRAANDRFADLRTLTASFPE